MRRRLQVAIAVLSLTAFLGACGGGDDDDDASPTTVRTTSESTTATTAAEGNALARLPEVFEGVSGFEFVELPESILEDLQDEFASDPDTQEAVEAADGRSIARSGENVGVVIAVGFDKKSAALPGVEEGFISGATEDAVTKRMQKLSGEDTTIGTAADGQVTVAWLKGTLALVLVGEDEESLIAAATALIAANK